MHVNARICVDESHVIHNVKEPAAARMMTNLRRHDAPRRDFPSSEVCAFAEFHDSKNRRCAEGESAALRGADCPHEAGNDGEELDVIARFIRAIQARGEGCAVDCPADRRGEMNVPATNHGSMSQIAGGFNAGRQGRGHELVEVAVENTLGVRCFDLRAQVLHELIGLQHV